MRRLPCSFRVGRPRSGNSVPRMSSRACWYYWIRWRLVSRRSSAGSHRTPSGPGHSSRIPHLPPR
eukprot:2025847-Rhodomonas_salina.2